MRNDKDMKKDSQIDAMIWLRVFRHRIIKLLLISLTGLGTLGLVFIILRYVYPDGEISSIIVAYFISYLLILVLLFVRQIPDFWRALIFLLLVFGFAVISFLSGWLWGGGRTFLLPFIILSAILVSPKAGLYASVLSLFTFLFFGIAFSQGWLTYELPPSFSDPSRIIIEEVGFAMAIGMTSIALWFIKESLTAANKATMDAQKTRSRLAEHVQELDTANQLLAERTEKLEIANKDLDSFSYSVSHDLRAPLRAIDSFSEILKQDYSNLLDENGRKIIDRIRRNTKDMKALIDDLLALSRLERQHLKRETIYLDELVHEVLSDFQSEFEGRQVDVTINVVTPCQADPSLVRQVFANLLGNALKYSRPKDLARIEVGSLDQEGEIIYYVRDNGVGFDMQYSDKLFTVFQRLHHTDEFEGTGVGLAIVQRIIQRHEGRIWVESEVDKGATFYFTFEPVPPTN